MSMLEPLVRYAQVPSGAPSLRLRIKSATWETPNIVSFDLRSFDGEKLPSFTAGAHIDLILPNGLVRSYSLINPQWERDRYVIAVQKDRASRGGSKWIHDNLRAGDVVAVDGPRNNFTLDEHAATSILIAGGIGITPMLCMIDRLTTLGGDWRLIYCSRKRSDTAFLKSLEINPWVRLNFDQEPGGKMLDIASVVQAAPLNAHFYCCGPMPMLEVFEHATKGLPRERVHVEYFTPKEPAALEGGFKVVLAKSGLEFMVPPGKSILQTLLDAGVDVAYSCRQGVCGTCETTVLEGIPDHRDLVLDDDEQAANNRMMICCSGSKSEKLVLDL